MLRWVKPFRVGMHMEPGFPSDKRTLSILFNHTIAFLLYVGSAFIGYELVLDSSGVSLIWPPAGVGIALVLMRGLSRLPVIFAGAVVVYLLAGGGFPGALVTASGYTLAAALTALTLNRFMGFRVNLATLKDACAFTVVAVVLLPLVSALAGALTLCCLESVGTESFAVLLGKHWIGDVVGILVFAPFLMLWSHGTGIPWRSRSRRSLEALAWLLAVLVLAVPVFRHWAPMDTLRYPLELALFPAMVWAAIRFGQKGTAAGILIISLIAIRELAVASGSGLSQPPGFLWAFVGVLALTGLFLAAAWTEFRTREDALTINDERLRAFVHALPDLALVFQENGLCSEIFAPQKSPFRIQSHKFKGQQLESIYPVDLARKFRETIADVLRTGELEVVRYALSVDGEDRTFEGRFAPIEAVRNEPPSVILVSYDLTENQVIRRDLQRRDVMLKALTEAEAILLKETVFHRGIRQAIQRVGRGLSLDLVQIYQIHAGNGGGAYMQCTHEWIRESPLDVQAPSLSPEDLKAVFPRWEAFLEGGELWELQFSKADERGRAFLSTFGMRSMTLAGLYPKAGMGGVIVYGSALEQAESDGISHSVMRSITDSLRGYMESQLDKEQFNVAKEAAIAADQAKSEFLAIMSHEIRTPMNAIIGFSDLLRQTKVTGQQAEYVDIISRSGKDLLELINNILDFSKLESNSVDLEETRFNLETSFIEVMEMVLFRAREKGLPLEFSGNDDIKALFWGDPLRLRQILINLLTNAIKFTESGFVRMEVETLEREPDSMTFEIRVIDTGIGIPAEHRADLFKAFRQVDSSTTREYGGTGLGLTIVQRLVDKMGGRISLTSTVGRGSTFSVVLRLRKGDGGTGSADEATCAGRIDADFARRHPLNILVAEDDAVNARLICEVLKRLGYEPEVVDDGFKALAVLAELRHDLVLMDMQMSRLDGLEATRRIRAGECGKAVQALPIVALTALALEEERERIEAAGVDHYLSKPIRVKALMEILEAVSGAAGKA